MKLVGIRMIFRGLLCVHILLLSQVSTLYQEASFKRRPDLVPENSSVLQEVTMSNKGVKAVFLCTILCLEIRNCLSVHLCSEENLLCKLLNTSGVSESGNRNLFCEFYLMRMADDITSTPTATATPTSPSTTMTPCVLGTVNPFKVTVGGASYGCDSCTCIASQTVVSGEYIISIASKFLRVFCVFVEKNSAWTAWTVIQRRTAGSLDFNKNWQEYAEGFGCPETELWLGNDHIHALTSRGHNRIRIELEKGSSQLYHSENKHFSIDSAAEKYRIHVNGTGFTGNIDDALGKQCSLYCQNGMRFSTYDQDNDKSSESCSDIYKGAWWFNDCFKCCLTCENMLWWDDSNLETFQQSIMMITDSKT